MDTFTSIQSNETSIQCKETLLCLLSLFSEGVMTWLHSLLKPI